MEPKDLKTTPAYIEEIEKRISARSHKRNRGLIAVSLPWGIGCLVGMGGLPHDFPWELLDEMPRNDDGIILLDIKHPGVKKFMKQYRQQRIAQAIRSFRLI